MNNLSWKQVCLIASLSLFLGVVFDLLFYQRLIGISLLVYTCLLLALLAAGRWFGRLKFSWPAAWLLLPLLFFAALPSWRASEFTLFWSLVLVLSLLIFLAVSLVAKPIRQFLLFDYLRALVVWPGRFMRQSGQAASRLFSFNDNFASQRRWVRVVRGLLITLPLVIFFTLLFTQADLVFKRAIQNTFFFDFRPDPDIVAQIIIALVVSFIWLGVYTYIFENASKQSGLPADSGSRESSGILGNIEANILYSCLNILFLAFVLIQVRYLFAGHEAVSGLGYSYSEYAHQGFYELLVAALVVFLIIFWSERLRERSSGRLGRVFKAQASLLVTLVLVVMSSAFLRLSVYIEAYGYTELRLLVQAFIVWLGLIFIGLMIKLWLQMAESRFAWGVFWSILIFFALFNAANYQDFIARQNIRYFASSGELDVAYLSSLSVDTVPALLPLLDRSEWRAKDGRPLPEAVALALAGYQAEMGRESWPEYNRARQRARRLISSRQDQITAGVGPANALESFPGFDDK